MRKERVIFSNNIIQNHNNLVFGNNINFKDNDNFITSVNIKSIAEKHRLWKRGEPFDFVRVYSNGELGRTGSGTKKLSNPPLSPATSIHSNRSLSSPESKTSATDKIFHYSAPHSDSNSNNQLDNSNGDNGIDSNSSDGRLILPSKLPFLNARPSPASLGQTFSTASELGQANLSQSLSTASQPA